MDAPNQRLFSRPRVHADHVVIAAGVLAIVSIAAAVPVAAQPAVKVSPLRVDITGDQGAAQSRAVTLSNESTEAVRIRARVVNWFLSVDGTIQFEVALPAAEQEHSAVAWTRLTPREQVVAPGEVGTFGFTTTVPVDAPPGGYRVAIMFELGPATGPASGDPATRWRQLEWSRVATLVDLTVSTRTPEVAAPRQTAPAVAGGLFVVQVAALSEAARADALVERLRGLGHAPYLQPPRAGSADTLHRVGVGPFVDLAAARAAAEVLERQIGTRVWITHSLEGGDLEQRD